jgi:Desulfoferrodoxin, N-terminal domain
MRRFLVVLCAGLVLAVVVPSAASAAPDQQLAAGTGTLICCGAPMVHVNAQSDQGGLDPRGHFGSGTRAELSSAEGWCA